MGKGKPNFNCGHLNSSIKLTVNKLGVLFDSSLKFDQHINSVVKSCFFHHKPLSKVQSFILKSLKESYMLLFYLVWTIITPCILGDPNPPCHGFK